MLKKILVSWAVASLSLWLVSMLLGDRMWFASGWSIVWTAAVVGLMNAILAPVINFITCPVLLLTLGLSRFLVSGLILLLADTLMDGFDIAGFWWAVLAALLISLATTMIGGLFKSK